MKSFTYGRRFEIYYSQGGHCGPYTSLFAAARDAARKLRGCRTETRIVIKDRAVTDVRLQPIAVLEKGKGGDDNRILIARVRQ
jgi:hypothetical protein